MTLQEMLDDVGSQVRALRERRGMRQGELATRASMSPGQISNIENGRTNPSLDTLCRIAVALNATCRVRYSPVEASVENSDAENSSVLVEKKGEGA